jgi:vacuolar-type H+-ATPase subunit D/Vma8
MILDLDQAKCTLTQLEGELKTYQEWADRMDEKRDQLYRERGEIRGRITQLQYAIVSLRALLR